MTVPNEPGTTTLLRLKSIDNQAWSRLLETYFDVVYRWCQEEGLDFHSSADVTQEVFVSALGSLRHFERQAESSSFGGWLRRITQRRIADFHRRKREEAIGGTDAIKAMNQLVSIRSALNPVEVCPSDWVQDDRLLEAIAGIQHEFEESTWQAFWQTTVEGRSTTEVALELGLTKNSVYLSKSRIIKRLRNWIDQGRFAG